MPRRVAPLVAIFIAVATPSVAGKMRRIAPRLGVIASAGPRVGPAFTVGPVGVPLASAGADVGFVVRPEDRAFANGARHGFFGKRVWNVLGFGRPVNHSHRPELRGAETVVGPIRRGDPVTGDAVEVPILPGATVLLSREGGVGAYYEWIPIPGAPYPWVRGAFTLYLSHPWLKPLSNPLLDGVDWVGRRLKKLTTAFRRSS